MKTKNKYKAIQSFPNTKTRQISKMITIWEWWIKWEVYQHQRLNLLNKCIPTWDKCPCSNWCKFNLHKWWDKCKIKSTCPLQCSWWHKHQINFHLICNMFNQEKMSILEHYHRKLLTLNRMQRFKEEEISDHKTQWIYNRKVNILLNLYKWWTQINLTKCSSK